MGKKATLERNKKYLSFTPLKFPANYYSKIKNPIRQGNHSTVHYFSNDLGEDLVLKKVKITAKGKIAELEI